MMVGMSHHGKTQAERDNAALDAEMTDAQRADWAAIEADEIEKAQRRERAKCTTTIERDEDGAEMVRYWDVYLQRWETRTADLVPASVMASLPAAERALIHAARARLDV
jgi:anti-sigma-K factor RskA